MTLGIVTDSACALSAKEAAAAGIVVVPLRVAVDAQDMSEAELTADHLVASLRAGRSVSTSQPTPAALRAAYDELAANGATEIVSIHLSEALSGTCGAARTAADNFSVPVRVVDSASIGLGLGFALRAAAAARDGAARGAGAPGDGAAAVDDVTAAVLACVGATSVLFYVDTLEYLRRGGRIGAAQAVVGAALSIKPILGIEAGRIEPVDKVRTSARALDRLVDLTLSRIPAPTALAVQHLGAADRAAVLAATLRERSGIDVEVAELGAAVGAHVGPGTLAVVAH